MYGYQGKVLHVDLGSGECWEEDLPEAVLRSIIGGVGLGSYLLYRHCPPGAEPLGPDNPLIFASDEARHRNGRQMGYRWRRPLGRRTGLAGTVTASQGEGHHGTGSQPMDDPQAPSRAHGLVRRLRTAAPTR